jgi:putative membrane protein
MLENTFFANIGSFGLYFVIAIAFLVAFKHVYVLMTPYNEWQLIRDDKNTAAAIGFGGAVLGFTLALASVISHSVGVIDFVAWGAVAFLAQLLAFFVVRMFMPRIQQRIEAGEVSAGVILAITSVAVGLLNAACMTY